MKISPVNDMKNLRREDIRNPIDKKIRRLVVSVAFAALLITSVIAVISIFNIKRKNQEILITQMETNLYNTIKDKARFADFELRKYVGYANMFADYINFLYCNPSKFVANEVLPPKAENAGRLVMLRTVRSEEINYEDIEDECSLLGNVEQIWAPFMKGHSEVSIFLAAKSGFLMAYDAHSDLSVPKPGQSEVYYDFTGASWYSKCAQIQRTSFTDIYYDHYGRGQMITVFAPFYNAE